MPFVSGTRLGPYEIVGPLGAGGMGEVYRARDTRLNRTVAIKVLPQHLSNDPVRKQRFEREARAISGLNHPNICILYDVGSQDGVDYLVMECVEGEALAKRLEKGPLPLEQVLKYGAQIADALDKAHRSGMVHRDLKPGNIMLAKSGAKVLDFGLAKPMVPLASLVTATAAAKPGAAMTEEGTVVGTFQYMSPEQIEGKELDGRSDIFSLGAVLYEMVTGKRAFEGKNQWGVASAILEKEPTPINKIKPITPPALDHAIRMCLAKEREERWQIARDLQLELRWISEPSSQASSTTPFLSRHKRREQAAWILSIVLLLLAISAFGNLFRTIAPPSPTWSYVVPPANSTFSYFAGPVVVSPNGRRLAFVVSSPQGKETIWVRSLDSPGMQELPGTEGASYPFWSGDSRFLGFFAAGKLKTIDASGGPVLTICDAPAPRGGAWNEDGTILFTGTWSPLYRVSSSGGAPVQVTSPSRTTLSHRWPYFLPDGRHFLYLEANFSAGSAEAASVYIGSLDSKESKLLLHVRSNVAYFDNHLLYLRERTLMAQPFDVREQRITGDAFPIAEGVQFSELVWAGVFSVSSNGVLAFQGGASPANSQLLVFDRSGTKLKRLGEPADFINHKVSPDGQKVVAAILDPSAGNYRLRVWSGDNWAPLTFGPWRYTFPAWSPDSRRIVFSSNRNGAFDLYTKSASGTGTEELLLESGFSKLSTDCSPDGRFVAFNANRRDKLKVAVWLLPLSGDRKPFPFLQEEFNVGQARFSRDGRWVAYVSDETGRPNVYVTPFPERRGKWQVSTEGGSMPRWRRDGKELFFLSGSGEIVSAQVNADAKAQEFQVGALKPLFHVFLKSGPSRYDLGATSEQIGFDIFPDGQSFVVNSPLDAGASPITLVTNWRLERPK